MFFKGVEDFDWIEEIQNPLPLGEVRKRMNSVVRRKLKAYATGCVVTTLVLSPMCFIGNSNEVLFKSSLVIVGGVLLAWYLACIYDIVQDLGNCSLVEPGSTDAYVYSDYVMHFPCARRLDQKLKVLGRRPLVGEVRHLPILEAQEESARGTALQFQ